MYAIADLAEKYGDGDVRLTVEQNFILSGVADDKVQALLDEPLVKEKFTPSPGRVMAGLVSCTGNQFCGFSNIATKQEGWRVSALGGSGCSGVTLGWALIWVLCACTC